jgi:PAS domain S-box-containing protein
MPRTDDAARQPTLENGFTDGAANDRATTIGLAAEVRALEQALIECRREGQTLRDAENLHRIILENVSDAVFLTDDGEAFTFICPNCDMIFGFSPPEVAQMGRISTLLGTGGGRVPTPVNGEMVINHECDIINKSGGRRTLLVNVRNVSIGGGTRLYVCRDITERKRAEEDAAAAHDEIRRLTERLEAENVYLRHEVKLKYNYDAIVGRSEAIRRVLGQVEQVADTGSTVLLVGETGTGKELVARAIHSRSSRHARPMVTVNCAALPAALIESELFGREEGAYTGALTRQIGRFELADGSTLFLDEVGELPPETQAKLLRVLQTGEFERLGSTKTLRADVRIVAATNRDLEQRIREKAFREDLFYRLNVFPIRVPPLRERLDDVPLLVQSFVQEFARTMKKSVTSVARSTLDALGRHSWPGNIRELRNVIERAMIVTHGEVLHADTPHPPATGAAVSAELPAGPQAAQTLDDVQRRHILTVLEQTGWRISGPRGAAAVLGIKPTTLEYRIVKLGISRPGDARD